MLHAHHRPMWSRERTITAMTSHNTAHADNGRIDLSGTSFVVTVVAMSVAELQRNCAAEPVFTR